MKLICPKCLSEYPATPERKDIDCVCGGHFSYAHLKWTYKTVRLKELPPLIKIGGFNIDKDKKE